MRYDFMIKLSMVILIISIFTMFYVDNNTAEFYMLIVSTGISFIVLILSIVIMKIAKRKEK